VGAVFFPLDAVLGLGSGALSERVADGVCWLCTQLPYAQAAEGYSRLTGVAVSAKTAERITKRYGTALAQEEEAAADRLATAAHVAVAVAVDAPAAKASTVGLSVDGTMVHLRQADEWREVRASVAFTFSLDSTGAVEVDAARARARLTTAGDFGGYVWLMAHAFGLQDTAQVVGIGDAADWIDTLLETQFPRHVRIVDWYHAKEYLWHVGDIVYGQESAGAQTWGTQATEWLWAGDVNALLAAVERLPVQTDEARRVQANAITYLTKHRYHLRYPLFRELGYPIGSGLMEGTCKNLVGARCKRAGMCWSVPGVQAVLSLRACLIGGLWSQTWRSLHDRLSSHPLS
jgi:hypothetical protein